MLKVSVIIPTYNRAEFLRQAIRNVLDQTFQDFEIIIVDDFSSDHSKDVVNSFQDQRIVYIRHEVNKGEGWSRNTGVINASGEYIAFLDDDDEWLPEKLRMQVELLDNNPSRIGAIYTGCINIDKANGKIWKINIPKYKGNISHAIIKENFITVSSIMLRRTCFGKVGLFDADNIPYGLDHDMWIRISREFQFEFIREPLVNYYYHNDQITNNLGLVASGLEALIKKHWQSLANRERAQFLQNLGMLYGVKGEMRMARKVLCKAIRLYPFAVKCYVGTCLTLFGEHFFREVIKISERACLMLKEKTSS